MPFVSKARLAALLALVASGACSRASEPPAETSAGPTVSVAEARLDTIRDVANASGTVVASLAGDWTVVAADFAEIVALPKKAGDAVAAGDILVRLEIPALTQELSALELSAIDASSRVERARTDLARQTSLFERGIISRNTFDLSRLELSAAETALAQSRARVEAARASEDRSVVRARFSGLVTEVFHNPGDQVRPGQDDPILRVVDPTRVQVAVELPLAQLARVVPGQSASVLAIAGATSEAAVVASKVESGSANAPTGQVRLSFVAPPTLPLGTAVSTEILLDQRTNVLVIPATGVQRDDLGAYVMVAGDDGLAHRRDVRVGLTSGNLAHIAAGLAAGERVIVSGLNDVREGTAIVVIR